ncbi:OmpA family protein [Dyadobacter arcticus]|uniref:Outer membrane protein OmpA-like peptidoglycan-associated protein n=1 Tax=Dyadobacter arcticus TaxID=1078754 RepID=A0ABX0UHW1_9BACT|nr:OmpA family protein [Dyadobacter arcticus]NIJ52078.1 outer membrane protein OmpA-like peptidoglycan-associated protein [Dyadobacter arcticus]
MISFIKRIAFCLFSACVWGNGYGQEILWASKVLGYSSEYRPGQFGQAFRSKQILGRPSKLPDFGNSPCAWSPAEADGRNEEWIKVGFEKTIPLRQIAIAENFNPGAIARVYAYDESGKEYLVLEAPAGQQMVKGRMLQVFPKQQSLLANAIKVVLQPGKVSGFNQIDAIGISEQTAPIEAAINFAPDMKLKAEKENMGKAINTKGQEVAPIISPDGKTIYFTRSNFEGNIGYPAKQDVWFSTLNDKGQWTDALNIGAPINNSGDNAITSISADGKTIYLINIYRPDGSMYFGFSKSFKTKTGWGFPKESKIINLLGNATTIEITVSPFENVLIMSVQRADTEGGKDLYISFLQKDNTWSEPRNLGGVVNTADYEGTPFLALDNKTLYFSSQGHSGYGEGDIFLTRRLDDTWLNWSKPENLGPNINSPLWDAFINIPATGDYAYFSASEKVLGQEDIFRIRMSPEIKPEPVAVVTGNVYEAETNKLVKSDIAADLKKDNSSFANVSFDPETGEYRLILPLNEIYRISASGEGYFPFSEDIDLTSETGFRTIKKNIYLQPIKSGQQIRLSNTMFAQSSADVVPSSYSELDRIVSAMTAYPTMEILLEGHTDNQGEVQKNVQLSKDRVEQVKKYLLSKGIESKRIQTKAWGPARPIASNQTEQTRQRNRRVEFTILKI